MVAGEAEERAAVRWERGRRRAHFRDDARVVEDRVPHEVRKEGVEEGRAVFVLHQRILLGETALVTARAELCLIDGRGRPRRPPTAVREALQGSQRS